MEDKECGRLATVLHCGSELPTLVAFFVLGNEQDIAVPCKHEASVLQVCDVQDRDKTKTEPSLT